MLVDNDAKENTGKAQTDNGGEAVNGIDQVLEYGYNVKGEQVSLLRDNNVDGKYDYREAYTLNANGGWTEKQIDLTNDGIFDRKEVYTKEADDGLVKTNFYNLVEGRDVLTKVEDYTLNANNQRTSVKLDTLGNGTTDSVTRYDFNALGVTKAYFDTDGNNTIDRIEIYQRNANGIVQKAEIWSGDGETIQAVRHYQTDELGRIRTYEIDEGNDSIIDTRFEYTYNVYGNRIGDTLYSYNSKEGKLDFTSKVERTYNELGQIESQRTSYPQSERNATFTYTYDEYGRRSSQYYVEGNQKTDYAFNDDGSFYSATITRDGTLLNKTIYIDYHKDFNVAKTMEVYDANEQLLYTSQQFLNNNGGVTNTLVDLANNGKGWDSYTFGGSNGATVYSIAQDFTTWSTEKLAELGTSLNLIRMGNGGVSELTLNAEVVAKISNNSLRVQGAADKNDVLNLSDFEKAASSDVRGYDLYTASFDGEDLKLYVQANDSITTNIIG